VHPAIAVVQSAALAGIVTGVAAADAALSAGKVTMGDLQVALRIAGWDLAGPTHEPPSTYPGTLRVPG
jgi:hypothetical protein